MSHARELAKLMTGLNHQIKLRDIQDIMDSDEREYVREARRNGRYTDDFIDREHALKASSKNMVKILKQIRNENSLHRLTSYLLLLKDLNANTIELIQKELQERQRKKELMKR
jgi:hypothetical protein